MIVSCQLPGVCFMETVNFRLGRHASILVAWLHRQAVVCFECSDYLSYMLFQGKTIKNEELSKERLANSKIFI